MKKRHRYKIWLLLSLLVLCACKRPPDAESEMVQTIAIQEEKETGEEAVLGQEPDVLAVVPYHMGFLVSGEGGYLAQVQMDGTVSQLESPVSEDLLDLSAGDGKIWAVGENGTVLQADGELIFEKEDLKIKEPLRGVEIFQGIPYVVGDKGTFLKKEAEEWNPVDIEAKGDFIGVKASKNHCIALTNVGEVAYTSDGSQWTVLNYNEYYSADISFAGISCESELFWIYGKTGDGSQVLLYSMSGEVWAERDLNYLEGYNMDLSDYEIDSLTGDGQQLYAWCKNGELLTLPDCVQCNKSTKIEGVDKGTIAYYGGKLLIIENQQHMEFIDTETAKQYEISAETSYEKQQTGAVIIDVRSASEYEEKHIAGSLSMEVGTVDERLPEVCPDYGQEIIFYCAKGIRSQDALEKAIALGYTNVYSLGSIDKWNYDFEGGN